MDKYLKLNCDCFPKDLVEFVYHFDETLCIDIFDKSFMAEDEDKNLGIILSKESAKKLRDYLNYHLQGE